MDLNKKIAIIAFSFLINTAWAVDVKPVTPVSSLAARAATFPTIVFRKDRDAFDLPSCNSASKGTTAADYAAGYISGPRNGATVYREFTRSVTGSCCPATMSPYIDTMYTSIDSDTDDTSNGHGFAVAKFGIYGEVKGVTSTSGTCRYDVQFNTKFALKENCAPMHMLANWNIICTP